MVEEETTGRVVVVVEEEKGYKEGLRERRILLALHLKPLEVAQISGQPNFRRQVAVPGKVIHHLLLVESLQRERKMHAEERATRWVLDEGRKERTGG